MFSVCYTLAHKAVTDLSHFRGHSSYSSQGRKGWSVRAWALAYLRHLMIHATHLHASIPTDKWRPILYHLLGPVNCVSLLVSTRYHLVTRLNKLKAKLDSGAGRLNPSRASVLVLAAGDPSPPSLAHYRYGCIRQKSASLLQLNHPGVYNLGCNITIHQCVLPAAFVPRSRSLDLLVVREVVCTCDIVPFNSL